MFWGAVLQKYMHHVIFLDIIYVKKYMIGSVWYTLYARSADGNIIDKLVLCWDNVVGNFLKKQPLLVGRNIEYGLWEVWPLLWAPKIESILNFIRIFNFHEKAVPQRHTHTHTTQNTRSRNISGCCMCLYMHAHVVHSPQNFFSYHNLPNILDCFFIFKKRQFNQNRS